MLSPELMRVEEEVRHCSVCVGGGRGRGIRNLRGTLSAFGGGLAAGAVQTAPGSTNWLLAVYQGNRNTLIGART